MLTCVRGGYVGFFLLQMGSVSKRFDTKNMLPSHRIKLGAGSCLMSAEPSAGRISIVHLAKKTYTLQSKNTRTLEAWAAALSDQIGEEAVPSGVVAAKAAVALPPKQTAVDQAAAEAKNAAAAEAAAAATRQAAAAAEQEVKAAAAAARAEKAAAAERRATEEAAAAETQAARAARSKAIDETPGTGSNGDLLSFDAPDQITNEMGEEHRSRMRSIMPAGVDKNE